MLKPSSLLSILVTEMPTKLLLCDTSDGVAQLQYALLKSGIEFETEVGTDGFRGVELSARIQPNVIVCEPFLEGLSGVELVRRLIGTAPGAKVICWTSVSAPEPVAELLGIGAHGYLLKEEGPESVIQAIH